MSALRAVKLIDFSLKFQWYTRWAVVKQQEDDPDAWGVVAWAESRDEARRMIADVYRRDHERGQPR